MNSGFHYTRLMLMPRGELTFAVGPSDEAWSYIASDDTQIRWVRGASAFEVDTVIDGVRVNIQVPSEDVIGCCVGPAETVVDGNCSGTEGGEGTACTATGRYKSADGWFDAASEESYS